MRSLTLVTLLLLFPVTTFEAQTNRKPWEWTLEERIAARTSPEAVRARMKNVPGVKANDATATDERSYRKPLADQFDGKDNPELFLPHQVFDLLLKFAFTTDAEMARGFRRHLTPDVVKHGFPRDFWFRLEGISAAYVADYRAQRALLETIRQQTGKDREKSEQRLELKHRDACRSRADALAAARHEFGRERFDRFLYEVVVVGMTHGADRIPDPELLRHAEEGCR